ncbi:hypothetical protein HYN48_11430 [Flavobacterium magnum]|uniref:Lipoprotein n=1 Tax=Flavobacterium magnum TaxID=2162713 RepID=A0A2S0RGJ1_9FLAO|nr:hypothetical protein [Flavobacterium magnum]AWA30649.1 hypothetical protein HYN48_11430 [Flavobacterium magnum]
MKNKMLLLAAAFGLLASCSNSDDSSGPVTETDYMPITANNYWVYDVSGTNNISGRDSLYVGNDTVISANTYKKLRTLALPTGFFSNSLRNNAVREANGKLYLTGNAGLNFGDALPVEVAVSDLVIFDKNAAANQQLGMVSGTLQQDVQGFPVTINYTLKSVADGDMATFTAPDTTVYTDVKKVKTILNLTISASFGGFPFNIMPTQDVVTSTQYYAEGIGMVYANTDVNYQLADLSLLQIELPIPQSGSQNIKEVLDTYFIAQLTTN